MDLDRDSWSVFDGWSNHSPAVDWSEFDALERAALSEVHSEVARVQDLCSRWRDRLADLGETPTDVSWSDIRPLRLFREEDWSDWLAFILQRGPAALVREFLGTDGAPVQTRREVVAGEYRADVVLEFPRSKVSIEVKLDDPDLEKTHHCCVALEAGQGLRAKWDHFVLLPEYRLSDWNELVAGRTTAPEVRPRTWTQLALAIRRCLWREDGMLGWRAWALAYCAAVEQGVLNFPSAADLERNCSLPMLNLAVRLGAHLTAGMEDSLADR